MIKEIFGVLIVVFGILDTVKYVMFGNKIVHVKTSSAYSRFGMDMALLYAIVFTIYGVLMMDPYIIVSRLFAIGTIFYCIWKIYLFYPYRKRGLVHFKRPNFLLYFINSLLPNSIRKRL